MNRTTARKARPDPDICPLCECGTAELAAVQCNLSECPLRRRKASIAAMRTVLRGFEDVLIAVAEEPVTETEAKAAVA
jgi:hypothetical protein